MTTKGDIKMKRKISFAVIILMLSLLLFGLTACGEKECGHSYSGAVTKAATCESDGVMTYTCSLCSESYTEAIAAIGHDEVSHSAKAPTCTEIGWDAYVTCSRCDYTTYSEIPATGHTEVEDEAVAPTCTKTGLTEGSHCSVCNTVLVAQETVKKLDHDYSEELVYNATHHYYECECGAKKDEEKHVSSGAATATQDEVCTVCGYVINKAVGIIFKTLTVNGNNVYGKVSNDTTYYSFIDEISTVGGANYIVSRNVTGTDWLPAKSVDLVKGDNTVYIIEMINDEPIAIYTVVIRRRPVYTVTFDTKGGAAVETQCIEEDSFATAPETSRAGYTFTGWDYDFSAPVMSDTTITASWEANTDTKYTVEYYLENLDKSDYELVDTDELTGTTDTTATAEKIFEHFTLNPAKSVTSGNISGNGTLVLKVYYTRNQYTLSNANTDYGSITNSGTYTYDYGETVTTTATVKLLGYEFTGWYSDGKLISKDATYTFTVDKNLEARFALVEGLNDFRFTSTATTCEITGIKNENATDIVIPDCVTSIGKYAFKDCTSLTSVNIGNNVTLIGWEAFHGCDSLTSVVIGNSVTSIGDDAFWNCTSLTSVTITDSVTSIGDYAFYSCDSLTSVTIPDSVTSIGDYAFYSCDKLVEVIDLSSLNITAGSNSYGYVGYYAKEVHNGESKIVNYNDYLFYTYSGVNYLLCYVGSDTELDLPESYNGEAYEIYDYAFRYCTSLTSVTIGNSVTTIGDEAFLGCTGLTSVIIPDSVKSIGDEAFEYCSSLTSVTIPNSVTSIGEWAFGNCTSLMSVIIPDSVKSIGPWAFGNCSSLTIYCEAASQPSGWNSNWNVSNRPVVWGYKAEE